MHFEESVYGLATILRNSNRAPVSTSTKSQSTRLLLSGAFSLLLTRRLSDDLGALGQNHSESQARRQVTEARAPERPLTPSSAIKFFAVTR